MAKTRSLLSCHRRMFRCGNAKRSTGVAVAIVAFVIVLTAAEAVRAQLLARPIAIENARLLTMDRAAVDGGTLLIKGERIIGLGRNVKVPLLAKKIDAKGGIVTPGLIDAYSALGLAGASPAAGSSTRRAEDAFDRYDTANLVEAVRHGVTAVYVPARSSAGICGTGTILRLAPGPDRRQSLGRVLQSEAALCIDLGSANDPVARLKTLAGIRKQFRDALEHRRIVEDYQEELADYKKKLAEQASKKAEKKPDGKGKESTEKKESTDKKQASWPTQSAAAEEEPKPEEKKEESEKKEDDAKPKKPRRPPRRPKLDTLLRALDREVPVRVRADRSEDILNALELAKEFSLHLILEGAAEAHLVADQIAEAGATVVLGPTPDSGVRRDDVFRRARRDQGAVLRAAGVRWILGSGAQQSAAARFIALSAQLAAGQNRVDYPLMLVTAAAADTLDVGDRIGRLRPGLLADLVLWSGDPLEPETEVARVYVGGDLAYQAPQEPQQGKDK